MAKGIQLGIIALLGAVMIIFIAIIAIDYAAQRAEERRMQRAFAEAIEETAEELGEMFEEEQVEKLVLKAQEGSDFLTTVYIQNTTSIPATLIDLYINGVLQDFPHVTLAGNAVTSVDLSSYKIRVGDEVMLVTERGTQIKFVVKF